MPWNGSGVFTRIYSWAADAAAGLDISSSRMDTDTDDIAQGLMHCLTVNGETVPAGNLPMANFRHTGASAGVALTDYATVGQILNGGGGIAAGGFLPISGGTITGNLGVNGSTYIGGLGIDYTNYYAGHAIAFGWDGSFLNAWVDNDFMGPVVFDNFGGSLSVAGNINVGGGLGVAGSVSVTGNAVIGGAVYIGGGGGPAFYDSSGTMGCNSSLLVGGNLTVSSSLSVGGTVSAGALSTPGSLVVNGPITCYNSLSVGNVTSDGTITAVSIEAAALKTTGAVLVGGGLITDGNRMVVTGGDAPSLALYNTSDGSTWAMWNASGDVEWGPSDSNGNPDDTVMRADTSGNLTIAGTLYQSSDRQRKINIAGLDDVDCLALVREIQPKRFRWRDQPEMPPNWGFVAQEVAAVMAAGGHGFGGHRVDRDGVAGLSYSDLLAVLWAAVQEVARRLPAA
jgi:Chaperone of endosialidase